jgi:hypothetical protein
VSGVRYIYTDTVLNRTPPDTRKTKTLSVDKKPDTTKTEIYCFSSILLSGGVWFTNGRIEVFGGMLPYMLLSNTNASKASSYPYIGFLLFFLRHRKLLGIL